MHTELIQALERSSAVSRRTHAALIDQIDYARRIGELVPLMPGTYAPTDDFLARCASVSLWDPDAVLSGSTAARLSWWPELQRDEVHAISRRRSSRKIRGISMVRGEVDADLTVDHAGFRLAHGAWSTLQLVDELGGSAIDESLRRRATTLSALRWALERMPHRLGNMERRRVLIESRAEPWSALERDAHVRLRRARIGGWRANYPIYLDQQRFLDIAFEQERVAIELDGWRYHGSEASFHDDRLRDLHLARAGWVGLRFTQQSIDLLVETVAEVLAARRLG